MKNNIVPIEGHGFFEEDEDRPEVTINVMETQKKLLRSILDLCHDQTEDSFDDQKIPIGANGDLMDKSLFTFKILIYDN